MPLPSREDVLQGQRLDGPASPLLVPFADRLGDLLYDLLGGL